MIATLAMGGSALAQDLTPAQAHMGHVTEGWNDTPDGMGLLPTAIAEAEIAVFHAGLAGKQLDNLDWMKTHSLHVLHAVDASAIDGGPGLGYGVLAATGGVVKHIGFATESDGVTDNIKAQAVHVSATANKTIARVAEIKQIVASIQSATSAAAAAALVQQLADHATQLLEGRDIDGDGSVSWDGGEGGLVAAAQHMGFMRQGEDL